MKIWAHETEIRPKNEKEEKKEKMEKKKRSWEGTCHEEREEHMKFCNISSSYSYCCESLIPGPKSMYFSFRKHSSGFSVKIFLDILIYRKQ